MNFDAKNIFSCHIIQSFRIWSFWRFWKRGIRSLLASSPISCLFTGHHNACFQSTIQKIKISSCLKLFRFTKKSFKLERSKKGRILTFFGKLLFWINLNDSALFVDLGKIKSRKINTWSISIFNLYPLKAVLDGEFYQNDFLAVQLRWRHYS